MPSLAAGERTLVLPTGEPAGTVATRTAGVAEFGATLVWDRAEDAPPGPLLPALPETVRCSAVETGEAGKTRREILGEVLALSQRDLGSALEAVLRSLTSGAAISGALLQTRVVRMARPRSTPSLIVQTLGRDLWDAGFAVRFGPSWIPSPGGGVAVGFEGAETELRRFFEEHPSWRLA